MSSQFIGLNILLTLNDPSHTQLRGLVAEVVGQELALHNVMFISSGYTVGSYVVNGLNIHDIEICTEPAAAAPPPPPPQQPAYTSYPYAAAPPVVVQTPAAAAAARYPIPPAPPYSYPTAIVSSYPAPIISHSPLPTPPAAAAVQQKAEFIDPAIVSMSRKPAAVPAPPVPKTTQTFTTPPRISATLAATTSVPVLKRNGSTHSVSTLVGSSSTPTAHAPAEPSKQSRGSSSAAALNAPFGDLSLAAAESSAFDETDDAAPPTPEVRQKFNGKRSRRGKSHLKRQHEQQRVLLEPIEDGGLLPPPPPPPPPVVAPGMFGGAIAQAANAAGPFVQQGLGGAGQRKKQQGGLMRDRRGRGGNRGGYDGNTTNAEEEGWATEDVNDYKEREFDFQGNLDRFDKKSVFSQLKAEDKTADGDRLVSFNRLQRPGKPSAATATKKNYHHHENILTTYPTNAPLSTRDGWSSPALSTTSSTSPPSRRRRPSPHGHPSSPPHYSSSSTPHPSRPTLRLSPSHRPCPIISPLQMLDVERIAEVELFLTDDMMTENAARGIAAVAISAFGKRIHASNHNSLPIVLVFAGNHKSGARAIAAGRHLKNHHVRVMVCVLGLEREDELLEHVRRQLAIFRSAGGRVVRWEEMVAGLKAMDAPAELIIDGLLGTHVALEDLRTDQRAVAFEMVVYANKSKAPVLAVDVPSGIDGGSGEVAVIEGTGQWWMKAKWVVCMGAPKSGLLGALVSGVGSGWRLFVADIGISNMAWRKYGTRRRHGVEFAEEWVVGLEFCGAGS